MIDESVLADARSRCTGADLTLFDLVLTVAQTYDAPTCAQVSALLAVVNLSATSPLLQAALYARDTLDEARRLATTQSKCGITVEYGWTARGVDWRLLDIPYEARVLAADKALTADWPFADHVGAGVDTHSWTPGLAPVQIDPGDALFVGDTGMYGGTWAQNEYQGPHVRTAVYRDGDRVICIEGGGGGAHDIHFSDLRMIEIPGELWMGSEIRDGASMRPAKGRRVWHIAKAALLPLRA